MNQTKQDIYKIVDWMPRVLPVQYELHNHSSCSVEFCVPRDAFDADRRRRNFPNVFVRRDEGGMWTATLTIDGSWVGTKRNTRQSARFRSWRLAIWHLILKTDWLGWRLRPELRIDYCMYALCMLTLFAFATALWLGLVG